MKDYKFPSMTSSY